MTIAISHCFLTVRDYDEALTFFRDTLGLEIHTDAEFEGNRWLALGAPGRPEIELVLQTPGYFPGATEQDRKATGDLLAKGMLPGLIFLSDAVDETFEKVRAAGAEVLQEPIDQPYGFRDCAFRDPSGNMIRFSSPSPG
jgi:catechol 2,3-dioxygenase-like lactoylglutathione lyase family enzyme